jgi:meso-butanediol dehydrogenase/(S,S)-butanediol dehydrogenase/diacetyl reductase
MIATGGAGGGLLAGRVFAIPGGSAGIGLATARVVLREGGLVAIQGRRAERVDAAVAELEALHGGAAIGIAGDAADPEGAAQLVDAAVGRFGRLDGLVVAAGVQAPVDLLASSPSEWSAAIDGNLIPAVVASQAAVPRLQAGGSIVFLGSIASLRGSDVSTPYAVAKGGLSLLARALAARVGRAGIRANCVIAGSIATEMLSSTFEAVAAAAGGSAQALVDAAAQASPAGRIAKAEEVAELIAFLLSDRGSFVNGADVVVDGGHVAALGKRTYPS